MCLEAGRSEELLVVFLKYPEPGLVKTRLAASLGAAPAAAIYRELVAATLQAVGVWLAGPEASASASVGRSVWIAFDPPEREGVLRDWLDPAIRQWPTAPSWVAQSKGDLGDRLQSVFEQGFSRGFSAICTIGTDCPGLDAGALRHAFARLASAGGVIGPAGDGGYYLIGIKTHHPELFQNIPWSSQQTLSSTLVAAERVGVALERLELLEDVDTEDDWLRWKRRRGI